MLIKPWICKANGVTAGSIASINITLNNWEAKWDEANINNPGELVKVAPFRLMAIANRLDLRNGTGYTNKLFNAGETRFIFTLVNLYTSNGDPFYFGDVGDIPSNPFPGSLTNFVDWKGFNAIFEFGNVQSDLCALKAFANDWLDLSELSLGSESYNNALEEITELVINSNASPIKPNGSALNQLRTNEKIFFNTLDNNLSSASIQAWNLANWQFRQFEIDNLTHQLKQVPLSNTVHVEEFNKSHNTDFLGFLPTGRSVSFGEYLTDWLYNSKNSFLVRKEKHRIPKDYSGIELLSQAGENDAEYSFYWDFLYNSGVNNNFNFNNEVITNISQTNIKAKDLRFRFSLNTCQGCHSGETKTFFTMVSPLKYGETADYWSPTPDVTTGILDTRSTDVLVAKNAGKTVFPSAGGSSVVNNFDVPQNTRDFVNVAAFITGRTYNSFNSLSYQDDHPSDDEDEKLSGLFFVNDPSNVQDQGSTPANSNNFFGANDKRNGFNELERRKADLCRLLNSVCNSGENIDVIDLISNLKFMEVNE